MGRGPKPIKKINGGSPGIRVANNTSSQGGQAINMSPEEAEKKRNRFLHNVSQGVVRGVVDGESLATNPQTKHKPGEGARLSVGNLQISKIVTGGQSGVDRGSLEFARSRGVSIGGWCPRGGWAEDLQDPPGLLSSFPEMQETNSDKVEQRTQWNVRDSDATVIFLSGDMSSGSNLTVDTAKALGLPYKVFSLDTATPDEVRSWLEGLDDGIEVLNLAGPRESETPGANQKIQYLLSQVFR